MAAVSPGRQDIVTLSSLTPRGGRRARAGFVVLRGGKSEITDTEMAFHGAAITGSLCVTAESKVGQEAEEDLRTGGARQREAEVVWG